MASMVRTAAQRAQAHAIASSAWLAVERRGGGRARNRVEGLAELVRAEASPRVRFHDRVTLLRAHLARLREEREVSVRRLPAVGGVGRYWPHQGVQECARRVRQMEG